MILFVGDIHHNIAELERLICGHPDADVVIQVGDLVPLQSPPASAKAAWRRMRVPVHFIDGNHHDYSVTDGLTTPTEISPGLIYHPRGTIAEIDGRRIGFLGGAESVVDLESRHPGRDYWPDREGVRMEDVHRLVTSAVDGVDYLVTHTPPACVVQEYTGRIADASAVLVERAWADTGRPELVCGHLHEHFRWGNVEVLPYLGATRR